MQVIPGILPKNENLNEDMVNILETIMVFMVNQKLDTGEISDL